MEIFDYNTYVNEARASVHNYVNEAWASVYLSFEAWMSVHIYVIWSSGVN